MYKPPPGELPARRGTLAGVREQVIIVPGYTPRLARQPVRLHPVARRRLVLALDVAWEREVRWLLTTGGAVRPPGTPYVEAEELGREAVALGWPAEQLIVEPSARHWTTNLRNAGRLMLDRGWTRGRVVGDVFQTVTLGLPGLSGFHRRCERTLGYRVGWLDAAGAHEVLFDPSPEVHRLGPDPLDP